MSRSKKKPYQAWACYFSNKKDKTIANRTLRKKNRLRLKTNKELIYNIREISNTYNFSSDGLACYRGKDLELYKKHFGEEKGVKEFNKLFRK